MPKLVYFSVQGRAQAIRYLLTAKGIAFEDEQLTFEQWPAVKEANTYGAGAQLPVFVADDGTIYRQSMAILKMLAYENGYGCETAQQEYESEWFYSTIVDVVEKPERYVFFKDEPTEEDLEKCIALFGNFITKVDARLADGRAHIAGDKITSGDFVMLAFVTSSYENPNLKHAKIIEALGQ